jgi:type VII secretion protein EccE
VATLNRAPIVVGTAAVAAAILLLATLARHRGRWWLEQRLMTWQFRRRRGIPARPGGDARLVALRRLAPGLAVGNVVAPDGAQVGVGRDDAGWYAVAAISPTAEMRDDPGPGVPLEPLLEALTDAGQPGVVLQVVLHTVPAPGLGVEAGAPASQSYRQLLGQSGSAPIPLNRATWVAVRVDAKALAEAGAEEVSDIDRTPLLMVSLVRRIAKVLRRVGIPCQVLDAEGLLAALARSCDLDPVNEAGQPAASREDWDSWHSAALAHRSFWLRRWPSPGEAGALLTWLTTVPAAMTNVCLILAPGGEGEVDLRCLVRLAAPPAALAQASLALVRGVAKAHGDLFPLNGEQGPAVYASAPTGGGPR